MTQAALPQTENRKGLTFKFRLLNYILQDVTVGTRSGSKFLPEFLRKGKSKIFFFYLIIQKMK